MMLSRRNELEVTGPSFCIMHNGVPCNKWCITAVERTPKGFATTLYFFKRKDHAETYIKYLQQCAGVADIKKKIKNPRTYNWERDEYIEFLNSIDLSKLENAVKNLKFEQEYKFYDARKRKTTMVDEEGLAPTEDWPL